MRWRNSFIYLFIFLLIGSYYYYFEVVRKEQKEAAEIDSKRLFRFQTEDVRALEILAKDKKRLLLNKGEQWRIVEPITTDVDTGSLQDFLKTLGKVDFEKDVAASPQDLKPYGLQEPHLKIRWQAGDQWFELLFGEKNPVGDGYYAKTGGTPGVYLIAAGVWSVLNKNLAELRKKELFSFQPKDVRKLQVAWWDGNTANVEFQEDGSLWTAPEQPGLKIKNSKVANVLDQLSWLRARGFLENESVNLKTHGLEPPYVTVRVTLKDGKAAELLLSKREKDQKPVAALSSQLPAVVQTDAGIFNDLPQDTGALEDRGLLSVKREEIKQVKWRLGESEGHAIQTGENQWSLKKGDKDPEPLKESWSVRSLLWDLGDAEYQKKLDSKSSAPGKPHGRLEIWGQETNLFAFVWEKRQEKDTRPGTLWIEEGGKPEPVQVTAEVISKIEEDLSRVMQPDDDKKEK